MVSEVGEIIIKKKQQSTRPNICCKYSVNWNKISHYLIICVALQSQNLRMNISVNINIQAIIPQYSSETCHLKTVKLHLKDNTFLDIMHYS